MARRNGGRAIRVLLAATSAVRRAGLETLVKNGPSLKLLGSLHGTRTIDQRVAELQPDVILLDLEREYSGFPTLPVVEGGLPMVALIDEPESDWTAHALRSGVKAILPREAGMDEILPAIQAAYAGLVLLDPEAAQNLAVRVRLSSGPSMPASEELTPREIEVLRMLAEGLGNRQMAQRLGISDHTVKFHISSILDKLGASSRTEAVTLGIRMGLILL
jgi:NarL family two-component system response regulator YdfI